MIYLDNNATTRLDERVLEAMLPWLQTNHGNPSSLYQSGRLARGAVDRAREQVAALVNVHPSQVVFTSGGTEANNAALRGVTARCQSPGQLVISAIEHASVIEPARAIERQGWSLDYAPVDGDSTVAAASLREKANQDTRLVSIMMANNENGTVQDISALSEVARSVGAVFHTDAVQAAGKLPVDFSASGAQLMSLSAHKMYGPKGVGALIIDKSLELEPVIYGGGQERARRGGTENVAGIVGFGAAAELAQQELNERVAHMLALREVLEQGLQRLPGVVMFAADAVRLPNTIQIAVPGFDGETLLMQLDREGVAVSSGSACASGKTGPSHVLTAMGVSDNVARSAVRISLGKDTNYEDIERFLGAMQRQLDWLHRSVGAAIG
jgi:cysteine desulfurase